MSIEHDLWMNKSTSYIIKYIFKSKLIFCRDMHRFYLKWTGVQMRYKDVWNISAWGFSVTKITDINNCGCTHSTPHANYKKPDFNSKRKNCALFSSKMQGTSQNSFFFHCLCRRVLEPELPFEKTFAAHLFWFLLMTRDTLVCYERRTRVFLEVSQI